MVSAVNECEPNVLGVSPVVNFRRKVSEQSGAEIEGGGSYPKGVWTIETLAES